MTYWRVLLIVWLSLSLVRSGMGQPGTNTAVVNTITTAVPFLNLAPDAHSGSIGFTGAATTPNVDATFWNASKTALAKSRSSLGLSYRPFFGSSFFNHHLYFNHYYKIRSRHIIGESFRFNWWQGSRSRELALDMCYVGLITDHFSMGISIRYVYSTLGGGSTTPGLNYQAGQSFAGDLSMFYSKPLSLRERSAQVSWGLVISNVGSKISYSSHSGDFLPSNLRTGASFAINLNPVHSLSVSLDLNKLLVPTNPSYLTDSNGSYVRDPSGDLVIDRGMDPNVSVIRGVFQSFYDAPGGFREEMNEISISSGVEYCYNESLALRMGYHHVPYTKGNNKALTFGTGWHSTIFGVDFAYVFPLSDFSTYVNTFYFTLHYSFGHNAEN